jgi:CheY-like chemotaxis protein
MAKIAIIDDENDVIDLVRIVLEKEGHTVVEAGDGVAGLDLIRRERPDIAIIDVMMPVMDGYTLNTHLLEDESTKTIPVIILTSKDKVRSLFQMAANVVKYIPKPFEPQMLKDVVKDILKTRNYGRNN